MYTRNQARILAGFAALLVTLIFLILVGLEGDTVYPTPLVMAQVCDPTPTPTTTPIPSPIPSPSGVAITGGMLASGSQAAQSYNPNTIVTASVTIQANSLSILWVGRSNSSGGPLVITDPTRTWDLVQVSGPGTRSLTAFRSLQPTSTTSTVTIFSPIPSNGGDPNTLLWQLTEYQNTSLTGVNGEGAVGQVVIGGSTPGSPLIPGISLPLGITQSTQSTVTAGFLGLSSVNPMIAGAGYTWLGLPSKSTLVQNVEFRGNWAEVADVVFASPSHARGLALELKSP